MAVLTVRPAGPVPDCATFWHGSRVAPASDNRPFPYLRNAAIPPSYLWMLGAILLVSLLLVRLGGGPFTRMRSYLDLAFMGAAFLLLETKNIVQFALLFGTTWFVNALVFAGVLVAVYLAVETARWIRLPHPAVLYGTLIAALAVAWNGPACFTPPPVRPSPRPDQPRPGHRPAGPSGPGRPPANAPPRTPDKPQDSERQENHACNRPQDQLPHASSRKAITQFTRWIEAKCRCSTSTTARFRDI